MTRSNGRGELCIHFTGLINERCKVDVAYADVKEPGDGHGSLIPCIEGQEGTLTCALRQFPTAEQIAAREAAVAEYLHRLASATSGDLKECLECRQPITKYVEVRPCVYAEPCGHRQWQGRAPR